ncbi:hypothetical protein HZA56_08390 [Candidatus Poribacteria bacterium]|nr:hypothetical protein [Candidatus Poribacteria bacterium]
MIGRGIDCRGINQRTDNKENRVTEINAAAPDCACEEFRMSKYSPHPVVESETLVRLVFLPIHISKKSGELKPTFFSHVHTKGCSIQRDSVAKTDEIVTLVKNFLATGDDRSWLGVISGQCQSVREIRAGESSNRAVCVYDTADLGNPAHAEMCRTHHIDEADGLELHRNLLAVFGNGVITRPSQYRNGAAWDQLPQHLQARHLK